MSKKQLWERVDYTRKAAQQRLPSTALVLGSAWRRQTYRNLVYILSAAPLGLIYLLVVIAGLLLRLLQLVLRAVVSGLLGVLPGIWWALVRLPQFLLRAGVCLLIAVAVADLRWLVMPSVLLILGHALWLRWRAARIGIPFRKCAQGSRLARLYTLSGRFLGWLLPTFLFRDSKIRFPQLPKVKAPVVEQTGLSPLQRQAVVPTIWRRLVTFERRFTRRWLGIKLPQGEADEDPFLWSSLLYLLVKAPIGLVGWIFTAFAATIIGWLLSQPLLVLFDDSVLWLLPGSASYRSGDPAQTFLSLVVTGLALVYAGLGFLLIAPALYVLNALAASAGSLALLMLSPGDTAHRLREAEETAERERAKAERAEQVRHELIVNVSHELRTPLANIRGHVESLLWALDEPDEEGGLPSTLRSYLAIVQRETESLRLLVDDLLALAHAESSELHINLTPVQAGEVVDEVHQSLAPLARSERRVTVAHTVEPDLPPVLADRQRLTQILLNLVRNAIAYTPEGGIVVITLQQGDSGHLLLSVADTGVGISEEELGRVFDRFYRTPTSRARVTDGFGLGLSIAQDLVLAMGGTISAESRVGEGSCFNLRLKIAESSESAAGKQEPIKWRDGLYQKEVAHRPG